MDGHLIVLLSIAAVWLAAGVVADGLPRLDRARALRRRTGWLLVLSLAGLGLTMTVLAAGLTSAGDTPVDRAAGQLPLVAVPALVVATSTVRRVRRLRAGAGAFAAAPETPAPYGLRAAAGHPLVGLPLQVTALATVPGLLRAAGLDLGVDNGVAGVALTAGGLAVLAIGVRHGLRHNRLAERTLPTAAPALAGLPASPAAAGSCTYSSSRIARVASNHLSSHPGGGTLPFGGNSSSRPRSSGWSTSDSGGSAGQPAGGNDGSVSGFGSSEGSDSGDPACSGAGTPSRPSSVSVAPTSVSTVSRRAPRYLPPKRSVLPGPLVRLSEPIVVICVSPASLGCRCARRVVDQRRTEGFNEAGRKWRRAGRGVPDRPAVNATLRWSVLAERAVSSIGDEGVPFPGGENEGGTCLVLRVPYPDRPDHVSHLDAVVTVRPAFRALEPGCLRQVLGEPLGRHFHNGSSASSAMCAMDSSGRLAVA